MNIKYKAIEIGPGLVASPPIFIAFFIGRKKMSKDTLVINKTILFSQDTRPEAMMIKSLIKEEEILDAVWKLFKHGWIRDYGRKEEYENVTKENCIELMIKMTSEVIDKENNNV